MIKLGNKQKIRKYKKSKISKRTILKIIPKEIFYGVMTLTYLHKKLRPIKCRKKIMRTHKGQY